MPIADPKPVDGMTGPLNKDPDLVYALKKEIERIRKIYPVNGAVFDLSRDRTDKRYETWRNHNGNGKENNGKETEEKV